MGEAAAASGPDFSRGVKVGDVPLRGTLAGRVGDQPVLLSRDDGDLFAVSGACTHYGALLLDGLIEDECVFCPLHHACFNLRSGEALAAPALDPLDCWRVETDGDTIFVREKLAVPAEVSAARAVEGVRNIVIVGGGAAALSCANELRRLSYDGAIAMLSEDADPPCDRPNLSKDYLAGTAPEDWIPLRPDSWYRDKQIDLRLRTEVAAINTRERHVVIATGERVRFDRLLIATGSEANRLSAPGFDRPNVRTLRSLADARALVERAAPGSRVAIIGSSFIGLEAAAAFRPRGVDVAVISIEAVPFERVLGPEIGRFIQELHERHGVEFHLGRAVAGYDGSTLRLADGENIPADFVLVGIGVRPLTQLAAAAGLKIDNGVIVDSLLQTSAPGVFAAGDIANYPDALTGERVRIEHWVTAERQGQIAAANMLGLGKTFDAVPFFWTEQYGVALRYVGRAARWDSVQIEGDLASGVFIARYFEGDVHRATVTAGNDLRNLEDERRFAAIIRNNGVGAEPPAATAIKSAK
jgi:NADPH-dependent 2,4-dienoyl-CoA reductase/sulfur reductase-like enzyme/nitrite reductase/ring-hydroxylating ferredoxin subunit